MSVFSWLILLEKRTRKSPEGEKGTALASKTVHRSIDLVRVSSTIMPVDVDRASNSLHALLQPCAPFRPYLVLISTAAVLCLLSFLRISYAPSDLNADTSEQTSL